MVLENILLLLVLLQTANGHLLVKELARKRMCLEGAIDLSVSETLTQTCNSAVLSGGISITAGYPLFVYDKSTKKCKFYSLDSIHSENTYIRPANLSEELWTMRDYDKKDDDCLSKPCRNGGVCVDEEKSYFCICTSNFLGKNCEDTNECASNPCLNGGTCTDGVNKYTCNCLPGYSGTRCQTQSDIELVCSAWYDNGYGDAFILDKTRSIQPNVVVIDGYECGQSFGIPYSYQLTETIDVTKDLKTLTLKSFASSGFPGAGYILAHRVTLKNFPVTITGFSKQSDNYRFYYSGEQITHSKTSSQVSIHIPQTAPLYAGDSLEATFRITYS